MACARRRRARRFQVLKEENCKLRQLVADLSLDKQMLQDVIRKKRWACQVLTLPRASHRYRSVADVDLLARTLSVLKGIGQASVWRKRVEGAEERSGTGS